MRARWMIVAMMAALLACGDPGREVAVTSPMVTAPSATAFAPSSESVSAAQTDNPVGDAAGVGDLLARQPARESITSRPPEPTARPGRGSRVRPDWLGTRVLPLRPDGFGEIQPTPFELIDRRFPPSEYVRLGGPAFVSTVGPVPADVLARSTWREGCPVGVDELSYVTVSYLGFDGQAYVGEMIVNRTWADEIVGVFRVMFDARFPIEQVRIIQPFELDMPPTGDGNPTTVFTCRPVTGGTNWSQHAYGLAIDINPFHNPYVKGDLVLPELAGVYAERSLGLPGMITADGPVVAAFDAIGWSWGGRWRTLKDPMHFSANGG